MYLEGITCIKVSMVYIDPRIRPETGFIVWFKAWREAGTLIVLLERSEEDPLVAPAAARSVGNEGPAGDLPAQAVCDHSA